MRVTRFSYPRRFRVFLAGVASVCVVLGLYACSDTNPSDLPVYTPVDGGMQGLADTAPPPPDAIDDGEDGGRDTGTAVTDGGSRDGGSDANASDAPTGTDGEAADAPAAG